MVPVERIWRIRPSATDSVEIRLVPGQGGEPWRLLLVGSAAGNADGQAFPVDVARAIAETMLEACEVAAALGEPGPAGRQFR
jgi:hypothetical protein